MRHVILVLCCVISGCVFQSGSIATPHSTTTSSSTEPNTVPTTPALPAAPTQPAAGGLTPTPPVGAPNAPHGVGSCDDLGAPGVWENITPAALNFADWCVPGSNSCTSSSIATYGAHNMAPDPATSGTLYLGTAALGFWKTSDCGSSWVKTDTGTHQAEIDSGRNWTIVIDPSDPRVIYTTPGYGAEGLYKSTDSGVNWEQILTADVLPSTPYNGFIEKISMDPTNNQHLLVSFHDPCMNNPDGGGNWACLGESTDSGAAWKLVKGPQLWSEGDGQTMIDATTWFFGNGGGIWRTTDAGANWGPVHSGGGSGTVWTAHDGSYYVGSQQGMLHSTDGGSNWKVLDNSQQGATMNGSIDIAGDGTRVFMSGGAYGGQEPATGWYYAAPESAPTEWTPIFTPQEMIMGGSTLAYDPDHKLLYSSNLTGGMWRVVVP